MSLNDQSGDLRPITRERIVEAARQLVFRQGYTATGISQILKAAEAKSGSLYHVLATMEGAVMLARAYRSFDPFDQAVHQLRDYIDRLIADGSEWSANSGTP